MKCEECQTVIEQYVDGELEHQASRRVADHAAACSACAAIIEELRQEQNIYSLYEREVDVTPALWAAIQSRIGEEKGRRGHGIFDRLGRIFAGAFQTPRLSPAFAAALVVVTIGVTVGVMSYLNSRQPATQTHTAQGNSNAGADTAAKSGNANESKQVGKEQPPQPQAVESVPSIAKDNSPAKVNRASDEPIIKKQVPRESKDDPARLVRDAEKKYLAAIGILARDVKSRRSQLSPEVLARFDNAIAEIDNTIYETRKAVRQNPGDPVALGYLLSAYSKKVDFLREMARD